MGTAPSPCRYVTSPVIVVVTVTATGVVIAIVAVNVAAVVLLQYCHPKLSITV